MRAKQQFPRKGVGSSMFTLLAFGKKSQEKCQSFGLLKLANEASVFDKAEGNRFLKQIQNLKCFDEF
jgi:hypothetical protein